MDEYYQVVQTLPQWLARPLGQLPSEDAETVHELRLRLGCLRCRGAAAHRHSWHLN